MEITIRTETPADYNAIAELNLLAFREPGKAWVHEMNMPATYKNRYTYDQDLALVAETQGKVVGFALFSPLDMYFSNQQVKFVFLAPLAAHPQFQNMGIGGKLIREGHSRAMAKGYSISLLFGDKEYYQRYGYKPNALSLTGIFVSAQDLPKLQAQVDERPIEPQDVDKLLQLWHTWHMDEPIALFPGPTLLDWVNHSHSFRASVLTVGGQVIGYIRYYPNKPNYYTAFLADGAENTNLALSFLRKKIAETDEDGLYLPVNPQTKAGLINCPFTARINMSQYALMLALDDNPHARAYIEFIQSSKDNFGVASLPAQFD